MDTAIKGVVSTFAWYQTANASVAFNATNNTASLTTTATTAADAVQVDVVLSITLNTSLEPTSASDGKTYVVRNGKVEEPATQPDASKRYSNDSAVTVTNLYYHNTTDAVSAEDARSLKGAKYKINLKGTNDNPGIRIDNEVTAAAAGTIARIAYDASGVDIGSIVFDSTNPQTTWVLKASLDGTGDTVASLDDKFYYAFTPQYAGAAGDTQASSETSGARNVTVIATLTAVGA